MQYTLKQLEAMPTIEQGHTDDLKIRTFGDGHAHKKPSTKVWLSRLTVEDGQPYNNQVTIEHYLPGDGKPNWGWRWVKVEQYQAK
jgi:hypothetical protein